jgi:hypothetical protein
MSGGVTAYTPFRWLAHEGQSDCVLCFVWHLLMGLFFARHLLHLLSMTVLGISTLLPYTYYYIP